MTIEWQSWCLYLLRGSKEEGLYEELRSLGRGKHTGLKRGNEQAEGEWQPDEWIRTSVWILEAIGGGHQGVANLRGVGLGIRPLVYTA
jgi:hypothetical protein